MQRHEGGEERIKQFAEKGGTDLELNVRRQNHASDSKLRDIKVGHLERNQREEGRGADFRYAQAIDPHETISSDFQFLKRALFSLPSFSTK